MAIAALTGLVFAALFFPVVMAAIKTAVEIVAAVAMVVMAYWGLRRAGHRPSDDD